MSSITGPFNLTPSVVILGSQLRWKDLRSFNHERKALAGDAMNWNDQHETLRVLNKAYGRKISEKGIRSYGSRKLLRIIESILEKY